MKHIFTISIIATFILLICLFLEINKSNHYVSSFVSNKTPNENTASQAINSHDKYFDTSINKQKHLEQFPENSNSNEAFVAPPAFSSSFFDDSKNDPEFEKIQEKIRDARDLYSAEGLAVLEPLLSHSKARVRGEAIDAIIQMDLPSTGKILRSAAQNATTQTEKNLLMNAAKFSELPSISIDRLNATKQGKEIK
jgi:hypothetical protein